MRYLARTLALAIVYLGAARIGLQYASLGGVVSLVWPATGVAIGALVLLGPRYWPGIAAGSFLALASARLPVLAAAAMAAGSTIEALVAAHILRRLAGAHPRLDDPRHLRALLLVAAPGGAVFAAIIGATVLWAAGRIPAETVPLAAGLLWAGNLLGALVVAPLFLRTDRPSPATARRAIIEAALLCLGTVVAVQVGLAQLPADSVLRQIDYHYLLFPFVVWAALRFGARGAAAMTLTVSAVSVWRTFQAGTPFVPGSATGTLLAVASYLTLVAATGLLLAASLRWERDRATRALLDSEERLRMAVDAARMGTWVWSVEERSLVADENLKLLYDIAPSDPQPRYADFRARVHPDDRDFVEASVEAALQSGGKMDHEFRILLPDGRVRWIAEHGEVRVDAAGRQAYVAGVSMDVTERRGSEERLRQAHRMDLVGRLAGGVAHEANNQMSVVLGSADFILRRGDVPDPVRTDVESIRRAAERTAAVTTQLLAFSRQQMLKPAILDLSDVVRQWSPVLMRVMGEDCPVGLRLDKNAGRVKADRGQLEQVLLNLAINARDAMPRGGMLTVETFTTELTDAYGIHRPDTFIKPGLYTVLAVTDTGEGMDQRTLGHAFEPFFTTKPVGQGTGLGLSTVYGIVKQSDGYVWMYSEPGQGTTCKIYLPLVSAPVLEREASRAPAPPSGGETILVVEDEPTVRAVVRRTLERAGYVVLEAENGTRALELAERTVEPISLIFTDVVMPGGLNGPSLVERLAALAPDAAVLYTSGYTDGEIVRRGLLRPDAAFLQKPVSPDALLRMVREQMEGHQARRRPL